PRSGKVENSFPKESFSIKAIARYCPSPKADVPTGLGGVKTKSNLVVALSGGGILAFFCFERDHKPQNSGCGYTAYSFHTAWANSGPNVPQQNRSYSITSSARTKNDSGIVKPTALAVLRLMTSSNLV